MKVLFVVTGNKGILSHIFANQLASLAPSLREYRVFTVDGKGIWGYLRNLVPLRNVIKEYKPDLIHAHYSLCGYLVALAGFRPIVVSLMGSDCRGSFSLFLVRTFHRLAWTFSIVKSKEMLAVLNLSNRVRVVPNGVDIDKFPSISRDEACAMVGFDPNMKNIVFIGNPQRPEKNHALALEAVNMVARDDARFHTVKNVPYDRINPYLRASDVLLLTSLHEGSPNVIKEAMACDLPIVSTDVGDVRDNIEGVPNCYVTGFSPSEIAGALGKALAFHGPTPGKQRLLQLGLDASTVSQSILDVYNSVIMM